MKQTHTILLISIALSLHLASSSEPTLKRVELLDNPKLDGEFLAELNKLRINSSLNPIEYDPILINLAQDLAKYMAETDKVQIPKYDDKKIVGYVSKLDMDKNLSKSLIYWLRFGLKIDLALI